MDIDHALQDLDADTLRGVLGEMLAAYTLPAFGALPKREVDLLFFRILRDAGVIDRDAALYQIMTDLRVSRAKARNLLFDLDIRTAQDSAQNLDDNVRQVILRDSYFKDVNWFVLEIENPLVQAHLRELCRRAKVVTDASFNPSIVRLPVSGLASVLAEMLSAEQQQAVKQGLYRAGKLEDKSFRALLKRALGDLATKFAGKAAGEIMDGAVGAIGDFLQPILEGVEEDVADLWSGIYS